MIAGFTDRYPGAPRILFVGEIHSSHAISWIGALAQEQVNVRAFSLAAVPLPDDFAVPSYVKLATPPSPFRQGPPPAPPRVPGGWRAWFAPRREPVPAESPDDAVTRRFAEIVAAWRPDAIHCLGLQPAALFFAHARGVHGLHGIGKVIIQLRGGSDLALDHADPRDAPILASVLQVADVILSDNALNFELLRRMGVAAQPFPGLERVPGTGGVDVEEIAAGGGAATSQRRTILWPKAYESPWAKGLPVLEALKLVWPAIQPCHVHMLWAVNELPKWVALLPEEMRAAITLHPHLPRRRVLEMLGEARVMLAPSLVDGTPNVMWEAMAAGAVPIVSPLETLVPLVRSGENVLFARNLYPEEIAETIYRAMADDTLVDHIAAVNRVAVRTLAGRDHFHPKIRAFYRAVIGQGRVSSAAQ